MRKPTHFALKLAFFFMFMVMVSLIIILPYKCPIRSLTGVICPGCGMCRAWLAVFHLDFTQALYYHPMFWAIPVVMLFALYDFNLFSKRLINILTLSLLGMAITVDYVLRLSAFMQGIYII